MAIDDDKLASVDFSAETALTAVKKSALLGALLAVVLAAGCGTARSSVREAAAGSTTAPSLAVSSTTSTTQVCTQSDMDAPPISTMPTPETVNATMTLDSGNETLTPPDTPPAVTAEEAWKKLVSNGFGPRASGSVRILLADLAAKTPATIQNYVWPPTSDHPDTQSTPIYTHTLVWVIVATDQAGEPSGGGTVAAPPGSSTTTVPRPLCYLSTAVSYVDAQSGKLLVSETF
jgi:hypothetical protein